MLKLKETTEKLVSFNQTRQKSFILCSSTKLFLLHLFPIKQKGRKDQFLLQKDYEIKIGKNHLNQ
jgi:hypothetical protein